MSFIGPASLSLFKPDIWACVLGLRAYYFKPNQSLCDFKKYDHMIILNLNFTDMNPRLLRKLLLGSGKNQLIILKRYGKSSWNGFLFIGHGFIIMP